MTNAVKVIAAFPKGLRPKPRLDLWTVATQQSVLYVCTQAYPCGYCVYRYGYALLFMACMSFRPIREFFDFKELKPLPPSRSSSLNRMSSSRRTHKRWAACVHSVPAAEG
eukprot:1159429-Pelagomonas_calceolata.AAC.3